MAKQQASRRLEFKLAVEVEGDEVDAAMAEFGEAGDLELTALEVEEVKPSWALISQSMALKLASIWKGMINLRNVFASFHEHVSLILFELPSQHRLHFAS